MNTKIDLKSTLAGLVIGVAVTFGIAAASSSGPVGRYQVTGAGNTGLVIDTMTGQVWKAHFMADGGLTDGDFFTPKNGEKK